MILTESEGCRQLEGEQLKRDAKRWLLFAAFVFTYYVGHIAGYAHHYFSG